jgi:hypothetical protein
VESRVRSYVERFAGHTPVTVPAGAAAVPPGTEEEWTLAGEWAGWPRLPGTIPAMAGATGPGPTREGIGVMRLYDLAMPLEIILATSLTDDGVVTVVRGDQGTIPTVHRPGFPVACCISADGVGARAQGVPSGAGVLIPTATSPPQSWEDQARHTLCSLFIPGGEARQGAEYEAFAFGYFTVGAATRGFEVYAGWSGISLGFHADWRFGANRTLRWRGHHWMSVHAGTVAVNYEWLFADSTGDGPAGPSAIRRMVGPTALGIPVARADLNDDAMYTLEARLPEFQAGQPAVVQGGRAWRAA